jgi:hypothetical protein
MLLTLRALTALAASLDWGEDAIDAVDDSHAERIASPSVVFEQVPM